MTKTFLSSCLIMFICIASQAQNAPLNHFKSLSGSLRVQTTTSVNVGTGVSATVSEEKVVITGDATLASDVTLPMYTTWPFVTTLSNNEEVEAAYRQWDANITFTAYYRHPCIAEGMVGIVDSSRCKGTGKRKARIVIGAVMNTVSISYDCQQEIDILCAGIGCKKQFSEPAKQSIGEKREFQIDMPSGTNLQGTKTFTSIEGNQHITTIITWDFHPAR